MKTPYQAKKIAELVTLGWKEQGSRFLSKRKGCAPRYLFTLSNSTGLQVFVYPDQVEYDATTAAMPGMLQAAEKQLLSA
ncbi:hypothetical protein ACRCPS_17640 [Pseudomonas aeruginosa]